MYRFFLHKGNTICPLKVTLASFVLKEKKIRANSVELNCLMQMEV